MTQAKSKLKSRPPTQPNLEAFLAGAGTGIQAEPSASSYPWEAPGVREDVVKLFNLRLPEP